MHADVTQCAQMQPVSICCYLENISWIDPDNFLTLKVEGGGRINSADNRGKSRVYFSLSFCTDFRVF